jgi:hypothetical protein
MESSIAEFLQRRVAYELLPTCCTLCASPPARHALAVPICANAPPPCCGCHFCVGRGVCACSVSLCSLCGHVLYVRMSCVSMPRCAACCFPPPLPCAPHVCAPFVCVSLEERLHANQAGKIGTTSREEKQAALCVSVGVSVCVPSLFWLSVSGLCAFRLPVFRLPMFRLPVLCASVFCLSVFCLSVCVLPACVLSVCPPVLCIPVFFLPASVLCLRVLCVSRFCLPAFCPFGRSVFACLPVLCLPVSFLPVH